ncbi:hypothetical protein NMY22_g17651 [Coprinellus aureogranulatus]|nr:hypothetical protein NMY22_g17651 [Coprinellus aureogranulatus]
MNQPAIPVVPNIVIENLRLQADAFEVQNLRLQLENLREQNRVLEDVEQRLTNEKADAEQALGDAEQCVTALEARVRDLERREERLEYKIQRFNKLQPAMLFNILGPMLGTDSLPENAPEVIEVEIRQSSSSTPNYDAVEKFDLNTITNSKNTKKPSFASQTANPWTFRLTCRGRNMGSQNGRSNDGGKGLKRLKM